MKKSDGATEALRCPTIIESLGSTAIRLTEYVGELQRTKFTSENLGAARRLVRRTIEVLAPLWRLLRRQSIMTIIDENFRDARIGLRQIGIAMKGLRLASLRIFALERSRAEAATAAAGALVEA